MYKNKLDNIKVDILLSTYNGEKYLNELLSSLELQTHNNWFLYVRDDGSTDKTVKILKEFIKKYPSKTLFIPGENIGVIKSFENLLQNSKSEYILLCDQDDIWLENKISVMLEKIISLETEKKLPALVFSDMIIIDENSNFKENSFWKFHGINPTHTNLNRLLLQNVVTGCASIINKNLFNKIKTFPDNAIIHDWWIALCATVAGKIDFVSQPTLKYRMHGSNQIGANSINFKRVTSENLKSISERVKNIYKNTSLQAKDLLTFAENNNIKIEDIINDYLNLKNTSYFKRLLIFRKRQFYFSSKIRTLIFFLFLK